MKQIWKSKLKQFLNATNTSDVKTRKITLLFGQHDDSNSQTSTLDANGAIERANCSKR